MAELVGLAVAIPPLIQPIKDSIAALVVLISAYRQADTHLAHTALKLKTHLLHVSELTDFACGSYAAFSDNAKVIFHRLIRVLDGLLADFCDALVGLTDVEKAWLRKAGFALRGRGVFKKFDSELLDWERRFNDVVFITVLASGRKVPALFTAQATAVQRSPSLTRLLDMIARTFHESGPLSSSLSSASLCLSPRDISSAGCTPIDYSSVLYHPHTATSPSYLLETHTLTLATEADVRGIASFLSASDPAITSLLACRGYSESTLKYSVPDGYKDPISLRCALLYGTDARTEAAYAKHSLDERLALMKRLASALLWVHVAGHVHKSIRADNIILFGSSTSSTPSSAQTSRQDSRERDLESKGFPHVLGTSFLLGFDLSRADAAATSYTQTADLQKAYYLHPDQQGTPDRRYSLRDDVYALGVLFIELALWTLFVRWNSATWERNRGLVSASTRKAPSPEAMRVRFLGFARKEVPRAMGGVVGEVIVACLEGLDDVDEGSGDGGAYIKKVLEMLDRVSL
ncbi:hypothetical protein BKA67DRAFT_542571 [Truncatella angustata]|uniref:Protein kinase domain-containing protein n=1 Tax=Truncatella angustata TaxID=152316 RepID=A0A9P8REW5_9PEZI|nr:uncharacterized protein BKA67DRAFT_542571 [Truncatella angustata]KAH6640047.1 hypothetical protein BKA67DRAFT_542571 [Truncatella angustata]KAH8194804.1 hypothetical protein TruAng_011036 [Truncatella angustata]